MSQILTVVVTAGRKLASNKRIFCILSVVDKVGTKIVEKKTRWCKGTTDPQWDNTFAIGVTSDKLGGLVLRVYEKHVFWSNKFLGIVTIKFNLKLLQKGGINDWFPLSKLRGSERVSGEIQLHIQYSDTAAIKATPKKSESREEDDEADNGNSELKVSSKWSEKDDELLKKSWVVVEEDTETDKSTQKKEKRRKV